MTEEDITDTRNVRSVRWISCPYERVGEDIHVNKVKDLSRTFYEKGKNDCDVTSSRVTRETDGV